MKCPECGAPVRQDDATCEVCQRPLVGEAGNAPRGSDPPPPDPRPRKPWNAAVWGVVVTLVVTAALLAVFSL
jgi:hypothetical protein